MPFRLITSGAASFASASPRNLLLHLVACAGRASLLAVNKVRAPFIGVPPAEVAWADEFVEHRATIFNGLLGGHVPIDGPQQHDAQGLYPLDLTVLHTRLDGVKGWNCAPQCPPRRRVLLCHVVRPLNQCVHRWKESRCLPDPRSISVSKLLQYLPSKIDPRLFRLAISTCIGRQARNVEFSAPALPWTGGDDQSASAQEGELARHVCVQDFWAERRVHIETVRGIRCFRALAHVATPIS
mmetsp:Transcript_54318/g.157033  ORF Transcript_54318/g.157033 Transcript_54318/m.157033 type:complete len:240 (+) Transcript_54318:740-1459(+)